MKSQISGLFRTFQDQWEPCCKDSSLTVKHHIIIKATARCFSHSCHLCVSGWANKLCGWAAVPDGWIAI